MHPLPTADLPADAVAIRRLRVRAGAAAGGATAAAHQVRRALAETPWPLPAGEAWVLLRSVCVRARTPIGIGPEAARAIAARIAAAVDLGDPAAALADAVYAADRDRLIAYLARDLAHGQAGGRWYWRAWTALFALPAGAALGHLLAEQPPRLAAVTARLAEIDALDKVWRALPPAAAEALLARLAQALALRLPRVAVEQPEAAPTLDKTPPVPAALITRWRPALAGVAAGDPRLRLAAVLVALEWRPLWLTDAPDSAAAARRLGALASALCGLVTPSPARATSPARPPAAAVDPRGSQTNRAALIEPAALPAADRSLDAPPLGTKLSPPAEPDATAVILEALDSSPRATDPRGETAGSARAVGLAEGAITPDGAAGGARAQDPGASAAALRRPGRAALDRLRIRETPTKIRDQPSISAAHPDAIPATPARPARTGTDLPTPPLPRTTLDTALPTQEGGLFYLVNFLTRPEAQALLRAKGAWAHADTDGWIWLYGLGRRLGLDPVGPLAAFLATQHGAPWAEDAETAALLDRLADLGARLYGAGDGPDDLWQADLLAVPALIDASPSHLDIHYPLACVRLAVRRVALDVDPGWVPWLGRVVRFHYLDPWPGPPR